MPTGAGYGILLLMNEATPLRPFLYLRQNLARLNFVGSPDSVAEYQSVFGRMLTRLDAYFAAHHLYDAVDYQAIVDDLLNNSRFRFAVSAQPDGYSRFDFQQQTLQLASGELGRGADTEAVLCHEFIHLITTPAVLRYREQGVEHQQTITATPAWQAQSTTRAPRDLPVSQPLAFPLRSGFWKEGFTEALKMCIYPPTECAAAYWPQTDMVRYLNGITDADTNWRDFLRGNWSHLGALLGAKQYRALQDASAAYHRYYLTGDNLSQMQQDPEGYRSDPQYRKLQDLLTRSVLQHVVAHPEQYDETTYCRIANRVIWCAPASADGNLQPEQYQPELLAAARALVQNKTTDHVAQVQYYAHLQDFLVQTGKTARQSDRTPHAIITRPTTAPEPERER